LAALTLEYWQDDDWFVGRLREVPGCFSQGESLEELERNVLEVYKLFREDSDLPIPANTKTKLLELVV
jgi:predicted RNase H-like HicB family nuclease